uniref:Uncharacterized protein n=1 Tax=Lepeophtheirus salmonis TaxID=72036 RepID=A0A0K2UP82_LEPSM
MHNLVRYIEPLKKAYLLAP